MSILDLGSLDDRLNLSDSFNSPFDKNEQFMGDHGENLTKAFIIAASLYGMGAGGGLFGGEAAGGGAGAGAGGSTSTGGAAGMFGNNASGMLSKFLGGLGGSGGGGGDGGTTVQRRRGIFSGAPQQSSPLFNFGSSDMIDPSTYDALRASTFV